MNSRESLASADTVMPDASGMQLEELTVVLLFEGPRYRDYPDERAKELANAHLAYTVGLGEDGILIHAGALIDRASDPKVTGLGLSRLSPDELRPYIEQDPSIAGGLESFRLVSHVYRKGSLAFPSERVD